MNSNLTSGSMQSLGGGNAADEVENDVPLGIGDLADDLSMDPLSGVSERKKVNTGSLILVGVVLVACGGLFFMRSLAQVKGASSANSELESSIEKFIKSRGDSKGGSKSPNNPLENGLGALNVLSGAYTQRQVPLTNVKRDPFILPEEEKAPTVKGPIDDGSKGLAARRAARQLVMEQAASRFELKSVIMSSTPLANVSGKIVRKGDELVVEQDKVAFRVANIATDAIMIVAQDEDLDLVVSINLMLKRDR